MRIWLLFAALALAAVGVAIVISSSTESLPHTGQHEASAPPREGEPVKVPSSDTDQGTRRPPPPPRPVVHAAVVGRVFGLDTAEPASGARVVLRGEAADGSQVSLKGTTSEAGRFQFASVLPGNAFRLDVRTATASRTVAGIGLRVGDRRDLGTLWMGSPGRLTGVVLDATGRGVSGAEVLVYRSRPLFAAPGLVDLLRHLETAPPAIASGRTRAGGRFEIADVAPGPVVLVVRARGSLQSMETHVVAPQRAPERDLVVRLQPSAPATGQVVDEDGEPIAEAQVTCFEPADPRSLFYGRVTTKTTSDGRFAVTSPPASEGLAMLVRAPDHGSLFARIGPGPAPSRLVLRRDAELILRLVADDTDQPIAGAQITVLVGRDGRVSERRASYATAVTNEQGEARVRTRTGVLGMIALRHPEHGTGLLTPSLQSEAGILRGPDSVAVGAPSTTLVFRVGKGVTYFGRVVDGAGSAIAGAHVLALGRNGVDARGTSDAEGRYVLHGLEPGLSMLVAQAPGYVHRNPHVGRSARRSADGVEYDLVMWPAAVVKGRVVDPDGRPRAGVRVRLDSESAAGLLATMVGAAESLSNAEGWYVLEGAAAGSKMHVIARHPDFIASRSSAFRVKAGRTVRAPEITLRPGGNLEVVVRTPGGEPLAGARVVVRARAHEPVDWAPRREKSFATFTTDAAGSSVLTKLSAATLTLVAHHERYASARLVIRVNPEAADRPTVTIDLRRAVVLRGVVSDPQGRPLANAAVTAVSPMGGAADDDMDWVPFTSTSSDAEGRFELTGLPNRRVRLGVSHRGYVRRDVVVNDVRTEVKLKLEPASNEPARRIAEIDSELMRVYGEMGLVRGAAAASGLLKRIQELQDEKRRLRAR